MKITTTLFLIMCLWNQPALALTIDIDDKVSNDLDLYRSFLNTSDVIDQHVDAQYRTIGADAECDYDSTLSSIQDAIDSGTSEVRIASNGVYSENIVIDDQNLILRGGFADCSEAEANNQVFSDVVPIDGSLLPTSVISILGNNLRRLIRLENILLTGGTSVAPHFGGGLSVDEANLELQLLRVLITGNSGNQGAGMYVDSGIGINNVDTNVFAQDLIISNNASATFGGGLNCHAGPEITLTGTSFIAYNTAGLKGGGIRMSNGCEISFYSEIFADSLGFVSGVFGNKSDEEGGGIFMISGSEVYLFGQKMCDETHCLGNANTPIYILENNSDEDGLNNESGGAVYMDGSSFLNEFYASGIWVDSNYAGGHGGAFYVSENSILEIERRPGGCWHPERCNLIINNRSGTNIGLGGGFYVDDGTMNLSQVYAEENRADFGTALAASGENAFVTIENSVFDDNGDNGADGYSDFQVFNASIGARLAIRHSTIVDNNAMNSIFDIDPALNSSLTLHSSIVHDPSSSNLLGPVSGDVNINCIVAHEAASFTGSDVFIGDPMFVDRPGGDYHLSPGSIAIDLCQGIPMLNASDMDVEARGWDDPNQGNGIRTFDAGADESYLSDIIFKDNFSLF